MMNASVWRGLRWMAVAWLTVGPVLVGWGAVASKGPGVPGLPDWLSAYVMLPCVLLVAAIVTWWRGRPADDDAPPVWLFRFWCVLLAASAVWPAWSSWRLSVADVAGGLPVLAPFLLAIGATSVLAGALALAVLGVTVRRESGRTPQKSDDLPGASDDLPQKSDDVPRVRGRWRGPVAGAGFGVAGLAVAVVMAAVPVRILPADATTAAEARAAEVPTNPREQVWSWQAPSGTDVDDVVAAGAGVVVAIDDGVVALDGTTGAERWHYRRTGAFATGVGASPDGGTVMVSFMSSAENAEGVRVIALDAMTGAETGFDEVTDGGPFGGVRLDMTEHVLLGGDPDEGALQGFDLHTGEARWEYRAPTGTCRRLDWMAARDVVLVPLVCGPRKPSGPEVTVTITLLALDDRTGAERWRFDRETTGLTTKGSRADGTVVWRDPGFNIDQYAEVSADGSVVSLGWSDERDDPNGYREVGTRFLFDTSTGAVLLDHGEFPTGKILGFDREWLFTIHGEVYRATEVGDASARSVPASSVQGADIGWYTGDVLLGPAAFPYDDSCRTTLWMTPWDLAPPRDIDVDFGRHDDEDWCNERDVGLALAPGAIVAWHPGATRVVGVA